MIMSAQSHLVHQFDEDLDELRHLLYGMGDLVLEQITSAGKAFRNGDIDLAQSVRDRDSAINALDC
jgi:phosphate uptake regulator